jgi:hypothetical protein
VTIFIRNGRSHQLFKQVLFRQRRAVISSNPVWPVPVQNIWDDNQDSAGRIKIDASDAEIFLSIHAATANRVTNGA